MAPLDTATRWAIVAPTGLIVNDCIEWTRRDAIERICEAIEQPWDKLRKKGFRAVKIKLVVIP